MIIQVFHILKLIKVKLKGSRLQQIVKVNKYLLLLLLFFFLSSPKVHQKKYINRTTIIIQNKKNHRTADLNLYPWEIHKSKWSAQGEHCWLELFTVTHGHRPSLLQKRTKKRTKKRLNLPKLEN